MKYSINLAKKKKAGFFEQLTYFFSHYLRYILVLTQLVVIGVLFYRFRIDQSIIDLKEKIDDKKVIIQETAPFIIEASSIEKKTTNITSVLETNKKLSDMIDYTLSKFPSQAFLTRIEISGETITMTGTILDPQQLQLYYNTLKKENRFRTVELPDLVKNENGFTFTLILNYFKS